MEENYLKAKQIVLERFSTDYPYYPMLVLGVFALLNQYPTYEELIRSLFLELRLIIEPESMLTIVKKYQLDFADFAEEEEKIEGSSQATFGVSSPGKFFTIENQHFQESIDQPTLILSSLCRYEVLLNIFVHEMNHLMKSRINAYEIKQEGDTETCSVRSGIHVTIYEYYPERDTVSELDGYSILEEAINTVQTTEMMHSILAFDGIYPDQEVQDYLDHCSKKNLGKDFGYDRIVKLFRPLWEVPKFRTLVEENLVEGNLSPIWQHYDSVMGKEEFEYLADLLDELDEVECSSGSIKRLLSIQYQIKNKIREYCKRMSYVYKK